MSATVLVLAAVIAAGCAPKDRNLRLARVAAQGRVLDASFDRLEQRLIADQARVRLWRELRERHESVSAVACASQEEHALEMAMHALPPERSSLHQARVAVAGAHDGEPVARRLPGTPPDPHSERAFRICVPGRTIVELPAAEPPGVPRASRPG